jgi:transposase
MSSPTRPSPTGKRAELPLDGQERGELTRRSKSGDRGEADRARVVLALSDGATSGQVAVRLGLHPVAVRRIKRRFMATRLEGMATRKQTGRPADKRAAILACVARHEQRGRLQDAEHGVLSAARIARLVFEESQIRVSVATVRATLQKRGIATEESDTP